LALLSRVIQHRSLLQTILDRSQLLERETFLSNDLALILIYDQVFGTRVRGKFKVRILIFVFSKRVFLISGIEEERKINVCTMKIDIVR
jgi:hypothetical protein